jgi:hypothetical protein
VKIATTLHRQMTVDTLMIELLFRGDIEIVFLPSTITSSEKI